VETPTRALPRADSRGINLNTEQGPLQYFSLIRVTAHASTGSIRVARVAVPASPRKGWRETQGSRYALPCFVAVVSGFRKGTDPWLEMMGAQRQVPVLPSPWSGHPVAAAAFRRADSQNMLFSLYEPPDAKCFSRL